MDIYPKFLIFDLWPTNCHPEESGCMIDSKVEWIGSSSLVMFCTFSVYGADLMSPMGLCFKPWAPYAKTQSSNIIHDALGHVVSILFFFFSIPSSVGRIKWLGSLVVSFIAFLQDLALVFCFRVHTGIEQPPKNFSQNFGLFRLEHSPCPVSLFSLINFLFIFVNFFTFSPPL